MEKIDCRIDENLRQSVDLWDTGYDIEWDLLRRIQLMKELHYSEKEIKAYRKNIGNIRKCGCRKWMNA